ncbi:unnamed protein product [Leuciscus chuanchicus]
MNVKTSHLERKVELLEMERLSVIQPVHATLDAHATLWDAIEKLVHERLKEGVSKIRTAREAAQECSCPPDILVTHITDLHIPLILHREKQTSGRPPSVHAVTDGSPVSLDTDHTKSTKAPGFPRASEITGSAGVSSTALLMKYGPDFRPVFLITMHRDLSFLEWRLPSFASNGKSVRSVHSRDTGGNSGD